MTYRIQKDYNNRCFPLLVLNLVAIFALSGCTIKDTISSRYSNLYEFGNSENIDDKTTKDAASSLTKADTLYHQGKTDEALYYYVRSLEFDDDNKYVFEKIANIHAEKGNRELAEIAYRMELNIEPTNAAALEGLGLIQLASGKYEEAKKSFEGSISNNHNLWRSYNGLGLIYDKYKDFEKSSQYYESALKIQPNTPILLNNLGYSKYISGDYQGALKLFEEASSVDTNYQLAWLNQGLAHARLGNESAALQAFRHVLNEADSYNNIGYIYMLEGKSDAAYDYFNKAISLSPTYHVLANENLKRLNASHNE